MNNAKLRETLINFVEPWNKLVSDLRAYQLDYTWPSVAILDLILLPIASRDQLSREDIALINGAAAYLIGIAENCWLQYEEPPRIECHFEDPTIASLELRAFDKNDSLLFEIDLSKTILSLIRDEHKPFAFFPLAERHPHPDVSKIQLFSSGLALGMSPLAKGQWIEPPLKLDDKKRIVVDKTLSASSATYYQSRFPGEALGANPKVYKEGLSFPPAGHLEPFLFSRAAFNTVDYITRNNITEEEIRELATNFTRTADDILSNVGTIFLVELDQKKPNRHLKLVTESKGFALSLLNPALSVVRAVKHGFGLWAYVGMAAHQTNSEELLSIAKEMLADDYAIGLMPILRISPDYLSTREIFPLLNFLLWGKSKEALSLLSTLENKAPLDDQLKIQKAHLLTLSKRGLDALKTLRATGLAETACYKETFAMATEQVHGFVQAEPFYLAAIESPDCDLVVLRNASQRLLSGIFESGDFNRCLELSEQLSNREDLLSANIFRIESLIKLGRRNEATELVHNLILHVPFDKRVFSLALRLLRNDLF